MKPLSNDCQRTAGIFYLGSPLSCLLLGLSVCTTNLLLPSLGQGQEDIAKFKKLAQAKGTQTKEGAQFEPIDKVYFTFDKAPWRDVIKWIAKSGDLALHYEDLPTGSFSYSDPNGFEHQDAIDRLNLFLLPQGYSLVQSGQLLTVINFSDPRSMQQLDALAPLVKSEDLGKVEHA